MPVQAVPAGFHTITPYLVVDDASKLIEFLQAAFAAQARGISKAPDGLIMHATVRIGDSMVMLGNSRGPWLAKPACLYMYVPNVDEVYQRAMSAGAESLNAPRDEFYGDRIAGVKDPCGNLWWIGTHIEDVSEEEIRRRQEKLFGQQSAAATS